jgi:phosphatidylglycerophosphatase A
MTGLGAPVISVLIVMAVLFLTGSIVCIKYVPEVEEALGKSDPSEVVADELAGQAVVFMLICFFQQQSSGWAKGLMITVLGFLLFRLFDIFKPWPIRNLEKLGKGWGVLADDLLAGFYAALVLQISIWLWISQN